MFKIAQKIERQVDAIDYLPYEPELEEYVCFFCVSYGPSYCGSFRNQTTPDRGLIRTIALEMVVQTTLAVDKEGAPV